MATKKNNKISITELENALKEELKDNKKTIDYHGLTIEVNTIPTLKDVLTICESVVGNCFDAETGEYLPEIFDFALRASILATLTNITLPSNPERQFAICFSTLYDKVTEEIGNCKCFQIGEMANDKVNYINEINISSAQNNLNKIALSLEDLENKFSSLFDGISQDDLSNIVSAMSDGKIDEAKLMEAYLKNKEN